MHRRRAFTLVELLVVISIIALLVAILLPSLRKARWQAKFVVCGSNIKQVSYAALTYASGEGGRLPPSIAWRQVGSGPTWSHPLWVNYHADDPGLQPDGGSAWRYLGKELPDPEIFVCPLSPGVPDRMSEQYWAPDTEFLQGTKFLLWNYDGFAEAVSPLEGERNFSGPRSLSDHRGKMGSARRLLMSELLSWDLETGSPRWRSGHTVRGIAANKQLNETNTWWIWRYGQTGQFPPEAPTGLQQNAAYMDGHVASYTAEQTVLTRLRVLPGTLWYLPEEGVPFDPKAHYVGPMRR